jgi:hypothetical protein
MEQVKWEFVGQYHSDKKYLPAYIPSKWYIGANGLLYLLTYDTETEQIEGYLLWRIGLPRN